MRRAYSVGWSRFWAVAPTVLIGCSWFGLWMLWPSSPVAVPAKLAAVRLSAIEADGGGLDAYCAPTLFGPPSPVGFSFGHEIPWRLAADAPPDEAGPRLLSRDALGRSLSDAAGPMPPVPTPDDGYRPRFPRRAALAHRGGAVAMRVDPCRELARRGFSVPGSAGDWNLPTNVAWHVMAHVALDATGRVEHVFIEGGVEDETIRRRVEAMLMRAMAEPGESAVSGPVRAALAETAAPR